MQWSSFKRELRVPVRFFHLWLGLIAGLFFVLMGVSGGIVVLRPQIAAAMAPRAEKTGNCAVDWERAEQQVTEYAQAPINRVYAPEPGDSRYRFRIATDQPILFRHVFYDTCASKVLGSTNLAWMDWLVDLHHNLLAGRTGRTMAGYIGLAMLLSGMSGIGIWLLASPSVARVFKIRRRAIARDTHSLAGAIAGAVLLLGSYTSLWVAWPQTMRAIFLPTENRAAARAPRKAAKGGEKASLAKLVAAAQAAIPDGTVREIRMPEGNGNAQIRMWRAGDFRSLGNNSVAVDSVEARVVSVDLYAKQPEANRFRQAMTGLRYGEWGGVTFRAVYALSGFSTLALLPTGVWIWWLARKRRVPARTRPVAAPSAIAG